MKENNIDYNKGINNHELKSKDNDIEYVTDNFNGLELEYKRILNIVGIQGLFPRGKSPGRG